MSDPNHEDFPPPRLPNQEEEDEEAEEEAALKYSWIITAVPQRRRTWVALFLAAYAILIAFCWRLLQFVSSWYDSEAALKRPLPEIYVSALYGTLFGLLAMGAALAVALPAMVVTWIAVLVLLACAGKSRRQLVRDGRLATRDIVGVAARVLVREGKLVAVACAVGSFFALLYRRHHLPDS